METREEALRASPWTAPSGGIYHAILGETWELLPAGIRDLCGRIGVVIADGEFRVQRSKSWIGRLLGRLAGLPRAAQSVHASLRVEREESSERWMRLVGKAMLRTAQSAEAGMLVERFGKIEVRYALHFADNRLILEQCGQGLVIFGLRFRWPLWAAPRVSAWLEQRAPEAIIVSVSVSAPLAPDLLQYTGRLHIRDVRT